MPISYRTKEVSVKLSAAARNARRRCMNSSHKHYKDYGGRGIEFRFKDIEACVAHLRTLPGHNDLTLWIDRIDNDGHYEVGNIQFTTRSESQRNRRRSRPPHNKFSVLQYHRDYGFDKCFKRLISKGITPKVVARLYGISRNTVCRIIGRFST